MCEFVFCQRCRRTYHGKDLCKGERRERRIANDEKDTPGPLVDETIADDAEEEAEYDPNDYYLEDPEVRL